VSKKVIFKNVTYSSITDFYTKNKEEIEVSYSELLKNINSGILIENAIKKQPRKKVNSKHGPFFVEGKKYINIPSLAEEYQLNANTVFKRLERGKKGDDLIPAKARKDFKPPTPKPKKYRYYIEGKGFSSKPEMCKYYGVNFSTYRKRVESGQSNEEALGIVNVPDRRKEIKKNKENLKASEIELVVNGKRFESISELAREYNMKDVTLRKRILKQRLSPEEAVHRQIGKSGNKINLSINGIEYESITQLAKAFNLEPYILYSRIKKGFTVEEAVQKPLKGKIIEVDGKKFNSIAEAARYYNLIPEYVQKKLKDGQTNEQALGLESSKSLKYEWNNNKFESAEQLASFVNKQTKIPTKLLAGRIKRGHTIDEAIKLGNEKILSPGRYNRTILMRDKSLANKNAILYFVQIEFEDKIFYKIGITTGSTKKRLRSYSHKLISQCNGKLLQIYELEQMLLKKYQHRKINKDFDIYLDGMTEFLELSDAEVKELKSSISSINLE
jgi:hypothetical protein